MKLVKEREKAEWFLIGAPIDQGSEKKGCKKAPEIIRKNLENFFFSETGRVSKVKDLSDITEEDEFEETTSKIEKEFSTLSEEGKKIFTMGGNHSITPSIIKGLSESYKEIGVLIFDAHPDCQKDYYPYGDVLRELHEISEVKKNFLVGVRNWSKNEREYMTKKGIPFLKMKELKEMSTNQISKRIEEKLEDCKHLYISIDIDFLDPAFAPGTSWREPGGIPSRKFLNLLQKLCENNERVIGVDLVGVNPKVDKKEMTSSLAAKVIFEVVNSTGDRSAI